MCAYSPKKDGDPIRTREWNDIARNALQRSPSGSWGSSQQADSFRGTAGLPPWFQYVAEVSSTEVEDWEDASVYRVKIVSYRKSQDEQNDEDTGWVAKDKEWLLDARALNVSFSEGDRVVVFWDRLRGAFVPAFKTSTSWEFASLAEELVPGGSAEAELYREDSGPDDLVVMADQRITVWDAVLPEFVTLPIGCKIKVAQAGHNGQWYLEDVYCGS